MITQLINTVLTVLIWAVVIGAILWIAGLKWKPVRHLKDGYFSLLKTVTVGIFNVLFKPTERRGIGNLILHDRNPNRRS